MSTFEHGSRICVLHIVYGLDYGGMQRIISELIRRADHRQVENHVLCLSEIGRYGEELGESVCLVPPMSRFSLLWPAVLIRHIRRIDPDIVHAHSGVWYKAAFAARRAGIRSVVYTDHGRLRRRDPLPDRVLTRLAARNTTVVVAVSEVLGEEMVQQRMASRTQLRVIPNGVDTTLHRPRPDNGHVRASLGISAETPIIGSIGRLEHIKGYDVMIDAFADLRRSAFGTAAPVLVIAGDGSQRQELMARATAHGLAGSVRFLGWRDDIQDLHAAFDLFTMSSRSEGTSVSLLEAMSAGLCPVVTDVGGNGAVLGRVLRHRLVPTEAPSLLARAWADALTGATQRSSDARAARRRVEDAFSLDHMVRQYHDLYRSLQTPTRTSTMPATGTGSV